MNTLELLKANLGITSDARNDYLQAVIDSVTDELMNEKGIDIKDDDNVQIMFLVDYAAWRYRERGEGVMPRNIQYRLHNLMIHNGKKNVE